MAVHQRALPVTQSAIAGILRHLKIPEPTPDPKFKREDINVLDPCAEDAKALVQLAEGLGVSKGHVFAIELNASRAARARFDKVALHEDKLAFISLAAFSQDVKAIRAALAAGLASPMWLKNVTLLKDGETEVPESVSPSPSGYRIDAHRLGFGSTHALFTCCQEGFLPNDSDDALWQELKQERFTAPLLRGWLPCIRKELELKSLLSRCYTLDCDCCILTATSADLDSIVESGLKNGLIAIQEEAA